MSWTLKLFSLHVCGIFILQQHLISGQSAFWGLRCGHILGWFQKNWSLLWLLSAIFGLNSPHLNSDVTQHECSSESSQSMKVNINKKMFGLWIETLMCHYFESDLAMISHCNALVPSNCYKLLQIERGK